MSRTTDDRTDHDTRLDAILGAYYDALAAGDEPDRLALIAGHPEFAAELAAYFVEQDRLHRLAGPLRAAIPPAPGSEPRALGDYELLEEIARGGMGVVYRARQVRLNRVVALKLILSGEFAGPADLQRFRAEAEAVAQLDHPNIVPIYEVGSHDGRHFFSMKFFEGGSLADHLDRFTSDPRAAASLVAEVARAVHHAHQRGILHRDLKPSNILLDAEGRPHVVDFGLAKRVSTDGGLTESGAMLGSPPYMAPEQTTGQKGAVTTATDVYGLGALLYTLLTGQPPFRADSALETIEQVKGSAPEPPRDINRSLDRDLQTICLKCLEKEPQRRYASAEALADDLECWLRGGPIAARPVGRLERAWRWARRNPIVAGLASAVALLAVAVIVGLLVNNRMIRVEQRRTEAQRTRAEANLRRARDAVDVLLTEVAESGLGDVPRTEPVRRRLMEKALEFYLGFLRQSEDDPALRSDVARAYQRVGEIHGTLGQIDQAIASCRGAVETFDRLTSDYPGRLDYRRSLAHACYELGRRQAEAGRFKEAEPVLRRSAELSARLAAGPSANGEDRRNLADADTGLGLLYSRTARLPEAEAAYRRCIRTLDAQAAADPNDRGTAIRLGMTLGNLGVTLGMQGKMREARTELEQSTDRHEAIRRADPRNSNNLDKLRNSYGNLAIVLSNLDDLAEAERVTLRAIEVGEELVRESPDVPDYRRSLATDYNTLADLRKGGQPREAEGNFRRALEIYDRIADDHPSVILYREEQAGTWESLGDLLRDWPRTDEALRAYRRSLELYDLLASEHPENAVARRGRAKVRNTLARLLAEGPDPATRDPAEAIRLARQAVEQESENGRYWHTLGVARYRADDLRGAIEALDEAARREPEDVGVWLLRAEVQWHRGEPERARSDYDRGVAVLRSRPPGDKSISKFEAYRARVAALMGLSEPTAPHRKETTGPDD